jgi:hypothetical protein
MDESAIREQATKFGDALVAGDVEHAIDSLSPELRRNLGEVLSLFPLPATESTIESIQAAGAGWLATIRLVGETDEVEVETRWKDRDGKPTIVEASHLSRVAREAEAAPVEADELESAGSEPAA